MMIAIGSLALQFHIRSVKIGPDLDYIMTYDEFRKFLKSIDDDEGVETYYPISHGRKMYVRSNAARIYEIEIAWPDSTAEQFMNLVENDPKTCMCVNVMYPSLDALYTLKMSHRYLRNSPHFLKTMRHMELMREHGACSGDIYYKDWFERREKETYDYSHPNLNAKKDEFFKDESFYVYDHDTIHEAIKLGENPSYKYIQRDGDEVKTDVSLWLYSNDDVRINCALEECYVLALERSLIPNEFRPDPNKAFNIALMKVCTSITSGWFREWCWENYDRILSRYNGDYVVKFKAALDNGNITSFKGKYNES